MKRILLISLMALLPIKVIIAAHSVVNLVIGYKTVYFTGKASKAIAINDQIPGPTLHLKEGDWVTINVTNHLDKGTAVHWHGIIVPWQMDGVEGVTQTAIPPGGVFHYRYKLRQSGTYWYHAHAGLQEQQGLYGALVVAPKTPPSYAYSKDFTIVLSDWINTRPEQVFANLKKSGDYYEPRFPLQPSLAKFLHDYKQASPKERDALINDYKQMQKMRMSLYDISDVAYDTFLLNGQTQANPWSAQVKPGDIVRLRFIGAGAATIFRVKIPGTNMQMVHAEGNDVIPYTLKEFNIAPGETYDVLVRIKKNKPYVIYAESKDKVGKVYGFLQTGAKQVINYQKIRPFPEPLPVTREMRAMMQATMHQSSSMHHQMPMNMPTEPTQIGDAITSNQFVAITSPGTKYEPLTAAVPTNDPRKPIEGVIRMELFGYMGQFIWFINGLPAYKAKPIVLKPGKRYRFVFTNTSMMHHPMHIHGHWFILRTGKKERDPLLHTIDVPPGSTMTADLDTDASGQWFFHCHMLYHMVAGMSRIFQYTTLLEITKGEMRPQDISRQGAYHNRPIVREDEVRPINKALVRHPMAHAPGFWTATFLDIGEDPFHNVQFLTYKGLYGPDYNKLELFVNDAEVTHGTLTNGDIDIFYWHLISQFWAVKGGVNYFNRPAFRPYWQPGIAIEGLMPFFIDTDLRSYLYNGSFKLDLELSRDTQITNNFFIRTGIRSILATKTVAEAMIGNGLNQMRYTVRPYYRVRPGLNVFVEYENEQDYGVFNQLQNQSTLPSVVNTVTLGLAFLF